MTRNFKISKNNIADYSFLGFITVLPFVDILVPIMLTITIVLAILFKSQKNFFKIFRENKALCFLLIYFLLAVISLSYSQDFPESVKKLSKLIAFVLIPLVFVLINPTEELFNLVKKVFVYAMMAFSVFSLLKLGYNYIANNETSHWYNFVQDSMYHKYMPEDAMYLNTAFVLLLFGKFQKNIKLIGAILFLLIIILFGVRIGLFVYLLIAAIYIFLNIKSMLTPRAIIIAIGVVTLSLLFVSQSRYANDKLFDTLQKIGFNTGDQVSEIGAKYHKMGLREKIWSSSIDLIKERPVLGHGAGVEKRPLAAMNERNGYKIPPNYHSHNQFLSVSLQYGVFGIFWLLAVFVFLFWIAFKNKNVLSILIVLVMFISMITESYLELQQGVFYFCIFTSLLLWNPVFKNHHQPQRL